MHNSNRHIDAYAGQSTFYIFLSIFPLINILLAIAPLLPFSREQITDFIVNVLPKNLESFSKEMITDIYTKGEPAVTVVSLAIALWSAARGVMAIRNGLNEICRDKKKNNYLITRGISVLYTLVFILVLVLLKMINLFGERFYNMLVEKYPDSRAYLLEFFVYTRGIISFLLVFIMLCGVYTLLPGRKMLLRYQIPGAAFTAGAWALVGWGFTYYIEYIMSRSTMYGSLTALVMFMLWIGILVKLVFFGAQLNMFLYLYVYFEKVEKLRLKNASRREKWCEARIERIQARGHKVSRLLRYRYKNLVWEREDAEKLLKLNERKKKREKEKEAKKEENKKEKEAADITEKTGEASSEE